MDDDFKEYLNGVFANNIPPVYLDLLRDMAPFKDHFGDADDKNFNLFTALRTLAQIFPTELADKWNNKEEEEHEDIKKANRNLYTAMYLELQNAKHIAIEIRLNASMTLLNLIEDVTLRFNDEIMPNQAVFIERIKKDIKKLKKEKKEEEKYTTINIPLSDDMVQEDVSSHQKTSVLNKNAEFEINPIWRQGIDKLSKLSTMLYEDGYTEHYDSFKNIFDKNYSIPCNWLKRKTSFLYLLGLLFPFEDNLSSVVLNLVSKMVVFKNVGATKKQLQTQLGQIKPLFDLHQSKLKEQYVEVHSIYSIVF